jgi:hypothetical protein
MIGKLDIHAEIISDDPRNSPAACGEHVIPKSPRDIFVEMMLNNFTHARTQLCVRCVAVMSKELH